MDEDGFIQGELVYYAVTLSPKFTEVYLLGISDLHKKNPLSSNRHFKRTLGFLDKHRNAFAILNGDMLEAVTRSSKGDIFTQEDTAQEAAEELIEDLEPRAHKFLGSTSGNHEGRIYRETGVDLSRYVARALNIPYRPDGLLLKISFGSGNESHPEKPYVFWVYATHGYGGARTKSAKAVKVERAATWIHADVYIMSHDHVVNVAPDVYLIPDNRTKTETVKGKETGFTVGKVREHRKMLVKSNAYLKWGGYSEAGGFPPTDLTTPVIKLLTPQSPLWKYSPDKPHQAVKVEV